MIPLIVSSTPEHESLNINLNSNVVIDFNDGLYEPTINNNNIKVENLNKGIQLSNSTISYDENHNRIIIDINDTNALVGNKLCGNTEYKVTITGLISAAAQKQQGSLVLTFKTVNEDINDIVEETPSIEDEIFQVINYYPKENQYIIPDVIKIKTNKNIDPTTIINSNIIITKDKISDINDLDIIPYTDIKTTKTATNENVGIGDGINKIFDLDYIPTGSLVIKINGVITTAYTLRSKTVTFTNEPINNDVITASYIYFFTATNNIITIPLQNELDNNSIYYIIIKDLKTIVTEGQTAETIEPFIYNIKTILSPLYSSIENIEKEYSDIRTLMNEDEIIELIHINSKMADYIIETAGSSIETTDIAVIEYVSAKTKHDIFLNKYLSLTKDPNKKTLADLDIEYSYSLTDLMKISDRLKKLYMNWENVLKGFTYGKARPTTFQRGSAIDENPDFMSRKIKDIEGTKSW